MRGILPICLAWLALNLFLFANRGLERVGYDMQLRKAPDTAAKRSLCWNRGGETEEERAKSEGLMGSVRAFETETRKVLQRDSQPERVIIFALARSTVFPSIARHLLFPATIQLVSTDQEWRAAIEPDDGRVGFKPSQRGGWRLIEPSQQP